jgi:DNA segregation ATPase FtsK/SpoIIIE, S-DNA-T family
MPKGTSTKKPTGLQRELWALGLLAPAILLTLMIVPPSLMGGWDAGVQPMGAVGRYVAGLVWTVFGVLGLLLPLLPALWAAHVLDRIGRDVANRLTVLLGAVLLLIPMIWYAVASRLGAVPDAVGNVGVVLGYPMTLAFGWLGSALLLVFVFAAVCIVTVGWNPLRSLAGGGAIAWSGLREGLASATSRLRRRPIAVAPAPLPQHDWSIDDLVADEWDGGIVEEDRTDPLAEAGTLEVTAEPAPVAVAQAPAAEARRETRPHEVVNDVVGPDLVSPEVADIPHPAILTAAPPRDELLNRRALDGLGNILIEKLATFKIAGEIVGMTTGPVVTQFEVSPAPGIKVSRIATLDADLALALKSPSVRIVAPIPGKGAIGVEVPNPQPEMVYFREVLESAAFRNSKAQLPLALGKDIAGRPYVADLAKMPHLLIAGATGSGKSVCVNTIITSLVYRHSPRTLRLLMVDPKMVELSMYNDLPHLRHPVVTDNREAAGVLKWAVLEMERRYTLLSLNNVRNLQDFNRRIESGQLMRSPDPQGEEGDPDRWVYSAGPLPYVVLIIDELADLMMTVQGEVEKPLALLAQKARAIGIHLILATQRPSVNVITGLIKANFPSRIAFRVSSKVDSRTILDQNGADSLLGNGDMLFLPPGQSDPQRIQGAFLSTEDTEALMNWYREQARQRHDEALARGADPGEHIRERNILEEVRAAEGDQESFDTADETLEDRDKLFREAAELCIQHQGGSTSLLQRRLRIGYGRAARIIDQLHHAGVLGPPDGSKPREVLVDIIQLDQVCPD